MSLYLNAIELLACFGFALCYLNTLGHLSPSAKWYSRSFYLIGSAVFVLSLLWPGYRMLTLFVLLIERVWKQFVQAPTT